MIVFYGIYRIKNKWIFVLAAIFLHFAIDFTAAMVNLRWYKNQSFLGIKGEAAIGLTLICTILFAAIAIIYNAKHLFTKSADEKECKLIDND